MARSKWTTPTKNLEVDDVVLLVDDKSPREEWRICRIVEILNSDKKHVRRVKLRDGHGNLFDRTTNKVVKLEL